MLQRSPEWYAARIGHITASRFADVMARGRGSWEPARRAEYRQQLVLERLTGQAQESDYMSADMQRGVDLEPEARDTFSLETGLAVEEVGFVRWAGLDASEPPPHMIGASPDGMVGISGVLEIKCPRPTRHMAWREANDVPAEHLWQLLGHMLVTGAEWGYFASYCPALPGRLALYWRPIERDAYAEELDALATALLDFDDEIDAAVAELRQEI